MNFLPEIESDMSVFHRIDDIYTMEAAVFFRRAKLLAAYDGALLHSARLQKREGAQNPPDVVNEAQADDEDALWAAHRQRHYAKFLSPGERPQEVTVQQGIALASQGVS